MNLIYKTRYSLILSLALTLLSPVINHADTPSDEELLQLEQQIEQQEAEQKKAKQRAVKEVQHEAGAQKLEEERARLEEERRKLEEERQAVLEKQKRDEEQAKHLMEEQQRVQQETEKRKLFEQFMSDAATAMDNHKYTNAVQAYTQALAIDANNANALEGQAKAREYQEICNTLIGEWTWFFSKLIVYEDGTMEAIALIPNNGSWECSDPSKRKFTLRWAVGGWIDTVTLSPDGNKADAINNIGMSFKGSRIDSGADLSSPKEVPL